VPAPPRSAGAPGRGVRALARALPRRTWPLPGTVVALGVVNGAIAGVTAAAVGFGGVFWVCAALSAVTDGLLLASLFGPDLFLPVA